MVGRITCYGMKAIQPKGINMDKVIVVLLDGLADRSYEALGNQTPLQAAQTPNLDRLARIGACGLYHASIQGEALPSETAHFLMFGYDMSDFPGRALLEASGEEIGFGDSDVCVLAHLCGTTEKNGILHLSRGRDDIRGSFDELGRLYRKLSSFELGDIRLVLHHVRRNDAIAVLSGDVSPEISDSDPLSPGKPIAMVTPLDRATNLKAARKTADFLNNYLAECRKRLCSSQDFPDIKAAPAADMLVTQRSGRRKRLTPFGDKWGFRPLVMASVSLYKGLARELCMDFMKVTDGPDPGKDLDQRIEYAIKDQNHDFIWVHSKAPDEAGHKGSPQEKRNIITSIDRGMAPLADALEKGAPVLAVILADHATPCDSVMIHSGETVPVIMAGGRTRRDDVRIFDEIKVAAGSLSLLKGKELMLSILNATDRGILSGHILGPADLPYSNRQYQGFADPLKIMPHPGEKKP